MWPSLALIFLLVFSVAGCQRVVQPPKVAQTQPIAWREGDVDDAFAEAKESGKPVMLYWGAKWCPPCNQLKSTVFKDPAFIAETRNFVPVHLDGDTTGAQHWGERFGISGYPTVIILRADGSEVARLVGASPRLLDVLRVTAGRSTSIDALLDKALGNPSSLSQDDWQLLSAFDWQNDTRHFQDHARQVKLLERLASAAPEGELKRRFTLLVLANGIPKGTDKPSRLSPEQQAQIEQLLPAIFENSREVILNRVELSYEVAPLIAALPEGAKRSSLGAALIAALDQVYHDQSLPLPDRLAVINADIALAKVGGATVSASVLAKVRARVTWADAGAKEAMVRQSVVSNAADLLHAAGDDDGAKRLLQAELKRSASPYYYMLDLATLAEDEKDGPTAIAWARRAYDRAEGTATRVQWAIEYSKTVLRQAPGDKRAVKESALAVIEELNKNPGDYYERTRIKVATWGTLLRSWSRANQGKAVMTTLETRMAQVCEKQGDAASACRKWAMAT